MGKHVWTWEEDLICARQYVKFILSTDAQKSEQEMIYNLSLRLKNISLSSIKMKISNLKAISEKCKWNDGVGVSPLSQYSEQSLRAYYTAIKEANDSL